MADSAGPSAHTPVKQSGSTEAGSDRGAFKSFLSWASDWNQFRSIVVTFSLSFVLEMILVYCAAKVACDWLHFSITFSWIALGFAIGSVIGTALSPYADEVKTFTSYWRSLVVFASGFLASTITDIIKKIGSEQFYSQVPGDDVFRVVASTATLIMTSKVMFTCRRYDGTGGAQEAIKAAAPDPGL